ncbi:MAG TPA: hydroxymethylbilane synthase [Polyangiaceae bacterium]|nr:hydroxymethylbilane synthase [Polyangiaceae bacterium]
MNARRKVTVATRKSALALAQSRAWMAALREQAQVDTEELLVVTTGDKIQDRPLNEVGGKGLFLKEIEEALLAGQADLAIHSLKDVPAQLAPGLIIGCVPKREDPRDAIKTRSGCHFKDLPSGAKVGTSSLRRTVQLRAVRPDLEYVPLRGNVDTRLKRCEEGVVDAVVLAYAGLRRLGRGDVITELLSPDVCLPAVGQGALGIEIRSEDEGILNLVAELEDMETAIATASERGVLWAVDGSCQVPVAAHAEHIGDELRLRALLAEPDGSNLRREELRCPWPETLQRAQEAGAAVGRALRGKG